MGTVLDVLAWGRGGVTFNRNKTRNAICERPYPFIIIIIIIIIIIRMVIIANKRG